MEDQVGYEYHHHRKLDIQWIFTSLLQRYVVERMAITEDGLVSWTLRGQYHYRDVFSGRVDLAYDKQK